MSKPVTPKVKKQVNESSSQASNRTHQTAQNSAQTATRQAKSKSTWRPQTMGQWLGLGSAVLWVGLVGYLVEQQSDQKWQIETINQLQQHQHQLTSEMKTLLEEHRQQKETIASLQSKVEALEKQLNDASHQPVISQADLQTLKSQVADLQAQMTKLAPDVLQQAQDWLSALKNKGEAITQSSEVQSQLQALQEKLQQFGQQMQALTQESEQKSSQEANPQPPKTLDAEQIQQWVVHINTQWQLTGNVKQTRAQLRALEQAVVASHLLNKLQLMKAIGEDVALLERYAQQTQQLPDVTPLRQWMQSLAQLPVSSSTIESKEATAQKAAPSAAEKLQQKFSALFSIHKRDQQATLTPAEKALLQQVWVQRGLLLVDQLAWAVESQNEPSLQATLTQLQHFVKQYFPKQQADLQRQLAPFKALHFAPKPSLHIMEAL